MTKMAPYYVYIILCEGNSFYTGYTKNLKSRVRLHMNGKGARYTRMHKPEELVYVEEFNNIAEAMKREKKIKRLNHTQKLRLAKAYAKRKRKTKKKRASQDSAQT